MSQMSWSMGPDDERDDPQMGALLSRLDPGRDDATYWMRFHRTVVGDAAFELARRRREAELTVVGVVSSWSRALLPLAMAAAAAAGIMLARPDAGPAESHLLVEEVLRMGLGDPIPASPDEEEIPGGLLLASEIY